MKIIAEGELLLAAEQAMNAIDGSWPYPGQVQLRAARLFAHMVHRAVPQAEWVELNTDVGLSGLIAGHIEDDDLQLVVDDIYDLEHANDLEWLASFLTADGAWREKCGATWGAPQIRLSVTRALAIELEGDEQ